MIVILTQHQRISLSLFPFFSFYVEQLLSFLLYAFPVCFPLFLQASNLKVSLLIPPSPLFFSDQTQIFPSGNHQHRFIYLLFRLIFFYFLLFVDFTVFFCFQIVKEREKNHGGRTQMPSAAFVRKQLRIFRESGDAKSLF